MRVMTLSRCVAAVTGTSQLGDARYGTNIMMCRRHMKGPINIRPAGTPYNFLPLNTRPYSGPYHNIPLDPYPKIVVIYLHVYRVLRGVLGLSLREDRGLGTAIGSELDVSVHITGRERLSRTFGNKLAPVVVRGPP